MKTLKKTNQGCLEALGGKQVTAVAFVFDYLRLEFEAIFLTVLSDPCVEAADVRLRAGLAGYKDMLCDRISQTVTEASEEKGKEIRLSFGDGSIIRIPLKDEERRGTEAALLQLPNEGLCVWHFE
jgi:hypothetical protein